MSSTDTERLLIERVGLVDVAAGGTVSPRWVVIARGRIEAVLDRPPEEQFDRSIDGAGFCLAPGLIDAHVHFFLDGSADPVGAYQRDDDVRKMATAVANARVAIEAGVTTMRDLGAPPDLMWELQRQELAGATPAPHIVSSGAALTRRGGHCHFFGGEVDDVADVRRLIDAQIGKGARAVKLMASGGGLTPGTVPHEAELPLPLMKAAREVAHAHGVHVTAHCHATEAMLRAVEAGLDMVEHASFVEAPGVYRFDEGVAALLRDSGVVVSPTASGARRAVRRYREQGQPANPNDVAALARLDGRLTNVGHLHRLGNRIIGGTDCGATDTAFDSIVDEIVAYTTVGLSSAEALRTATSESAGYLGLGQVGQVAIGFGADLVLLRADPLADLSAYRTPAMVLKSGRILVDRRH